MGLGHSKGPTTGVHGVCGFAWKMSILWYIIIIWVFGRLPCGLLVAVSAPTMWILPSTTLPALGSFYKSCMTCPVEIHLWPSTMGSPGVTWACILLLLVLCVIHLDVQKCLVLVLPMPTSHANGVYCRLNVLTVPAEPCTQLGTYNQWQPTYVSLWWI